VSQKVDSREKSVKKTATAVRKNLKSKKKLTKKNSQFLESLGLTLRK